VGTPAAAAAARPGPARPGPAHCLPLGGGGARNQREPGQCVGMAGKKGSKSIFMSARWTYGRLVGDQLDGADKSTLRVYRKGPQISWGVRGDNRWRQQARTMPRALSPPPSKNRAPRRTQGACRAGGEVAGSGCGDTRCCCACLPCHAMPCHAVVFCHEVGGAGTLWGWRPLAIAFARRRLCLRGVRVRAARRLAGWLSNWLLRRAMGMVGCSSRGKLHCCGGQCLPRLPMHQRHHHRHCLRQHQQRPQDTTARTTIRQPCDRTQNRLHNTTSAHEPCRWVGACVGQIRGVVGLHARSAAFGEGGCVFAIPSARCVCHARTHALCNNTISKSCPARDGAKELLVRRWGLEIKNQNKTWPSGHFLGGLNMAVDFGGARNQLIQHRTNSSWARART